MDDKPRLFYFHFMFLSVVGGIVLQVCDLIAVAVAFLLRGNILYTQIGKESAFFQVVRITRNGKFL